MAYGLVGLYAIYFIFVGINGNARKMTDAVQTDGKDYLVWILAIVILRALYANEKARPVVGAFSTLVLVSFFLMHYKTLAGELNRITGRNLFTV